jgi:rod shape-determining protein MreD
VNGAVVFDALKAAVLLFFVVLVQVSLASAYAPLGGSANLVLVVLIAIALLRGSIFGAVAGFCTGLLLDTATLGLLGFTSLLLTLAGFWIGRYGETTARDRFHAPFASVAVITVLYALGSIVLDFVLGQSDPASAVLSGLPSTVLLNLILAWPVYWCVRRLLPFGGSAERVHEVRLLG